MVLDTPSMSTIFNGDYEMMVFGSLPSELRDKIVDIEGNQMSITDVDPFSLVCVQISANPGVKPFVISNGNTTFDLFKILTKQRGISIESLRKKLQQLSSA